MSLLRLPAVSRLQKKYNVNLAMAKLQQYGISIPDGINAHHVMDGHREIVLALLWCIISHFCMNRLLKGESVEYEIEKVIRSTQARQKMQDKTILFRVAQPKSAFSESTPGLNEAEEPPESTLRQLLLRWGQAVCAAFGTKVIDFSGSFADGKAICLLIHYYHPSLIRLDDILLADDVIDESLSTIKEQKRWLRASKALHELGGIPNMLPRCDSTHPPDEKAMLLSLSYLFSRLTESSNEILAAILIQACYRKYKHRILLQKKIVAAGFILQFWKLNRENYFRYQQRRYAAAVAKLEEFVMTRKHSLKRLKAERLERERRHRSAILIQVRIHSIHSDCLACRRDHASLNRAHFFSLECILLSNSSAENFPWRHWTVARKRGLPALLCNVDLANFFSLLFSA
jgi:abnormal spindle-like microcephaly-associated protein